MTLNSQFCSPGRAIVRKIKITPSASAVAKTTMCIRLVHGNGCSWGTKGKRNAKSPGSMWHSLRRISAGLRVRIIAESAILEPAEQSPAETSDSRSRADQAEEDECGRTVLMRENPVERCAFDIGA